MTDATIDSSGKALRRDGSPLFVLADTAWSAFADASIEEWRHYVRFRVAQGFTHVMVSALPILHDRAVRDGAREPFALDEHGHYRYDAPDENYWETAELFAQLARDEGLALGLVLLWCNYVGGTWGADRTPWAVMPDADRVAFVDRTVRRFAPYSPLFIVSGDERFDGDVSRRVYREALELTKRLAPGLLTTMHSTPDTELPASISDAPELDFYSYQAGHDHERQDITWTLAEYYLSRAVRRPIMDLEPCYEGHGFGGGLGRYRRADVRRASWWSILGGASAGLGYGAHGVWQWYRDGARFTSPEFSLEPFAWQTALEFGGASDVALAARLVTDHGLVGAEPAQDLLEQPYAGLRAARGHDTDAIAIYLPDPREVRVAMDLDGRRVTAWDLHGRRVLTPRLVADGSSTIVRQPDVLADVLLLIN